MGQVLRSVVKSVTYNAIAFVHILTVLSRLVFWQLC